MYTKPSGEVSRLKRRREREVEKETKKDHCAKWIETSENRTELAKRNKRHIKRRQTNDFLFDRKQDTSKRERRKWQPREMQSLWNRFPMCVVHLLCFVFNFFLNFWFLFGLYALTPLHLNAKDASLMPNDYSVLTQYNHHTHTKQ